MKLNFRLPALRRASWWIALVLALAPATLQAAHEGLHPAGAALRRVDATATRLFDGRVLVAGGFTSFPTATATAEIYDPTSGTWSPTRSMSTPRAYYTATLLQDGRVLVAGGVPGTSDGSFSQGSPLNSAEIYDPQTGHWGGAGLLNDARYQHTATLLPNGKVLVTGGTGQFNSSLSSAELYDPTQNTWASTGSMHVPRSAHTATLLANGTVLVAGGESQDFTESAELYDPSKGSWTVTGAMITPRSRHVAILLASGKVLVTAGVDARSFAALATSEFYDPANGKWTSTGPLSVARAAPSATLLANGQVLVAGGVFLSDSRSAEIFTPSTGVWRLGAGMVEPRSGHTATLLLNGMVLVAGGGSTPGSAELFDPNGSQWSAVQGMSQTRAGAAAVTLPNGDVLVAGGLGDIPVQPFAAIRASAERFSSSSNTWTSAAPMQAPREGLSMTLLRNGLVLAAGGLTAPGSTVATAELYDPRKNTWQTTGSMHQARLNQTATLLPSGKVLVTGGLYLDGTSGTVQILASAELYDPKSGAWTQVAPLHTARNFHAAVLMGNGKVMVVGGGAGDGSSLASVEIYDPVKNTWTATPDMWDDREQETASLLPGGKILVAGGCTVDFFGFCTALSEAEIYDPSINDWSFTSSMHDPRFGAMTAPLPGGGVLEAGGFSNRAGHTLTASEWYNPSARRWTSIGRIGVFGAMKAAVAVLRGGTVLIAGGASERGGTGGVNSQLGDTELYNPTSGAWSLAGSM